MALTLRTVHELLKSHKPDLTITETARMLNIVLREISVELKSHESSYLFEDGTVAGQRYYPLPDEFIGVRAVMLNGKPIGHLVGTPGFEEDDLT